MHVGGITFLTSLKPIRQDHSRLGTKVFWIARNQCSGVYLSRRPDDRIRQFYLRFMTYDNRAFRYFIGHRQ